MAKKRKRGSDTSGQPKGIGPDTSKPTAVYRPSGGRTNTLSIALPGGIIANAQSHDQKTYLAGTIARALAVFCVDEIVIFEDESSPTLRQEDADGDQYTAFSDPSHFLAHILSYLETPAYLRKALFGMHPNLRTAGTLPSLDMPHHLRANEWCEYREGVTVDDHQPTRSSGTEADIGLPQRYTIPGVHIPPGTRVTLHLNEHGTEAEPVAPSDPKEQAGYYWGYVVRRCSSLSAVFTECPYDDGYDVSFGTSERGEPISKVLLTGKPPRPMHMLVVFGGVAGLEAAAKADPELEAKGIGAGNVRDLFDYWINVLPGQGSRTIRTEEAVWLALMGLRDLYQVAPGV